MFVFVGGLVVLALTAALVAPYFIDWNHYRSAFEREAGRVLGRQVRVEGTARARLLPFPSLTFTDVVVAGETPEVPGMTVEEFSMDAELAPFLRGEVLIFDMRLVRPRARISVAADGGIDWTVRPSGPFDPRQVTLEKVTIIDGSVDLRHDASGRAHTLTDIDAELSARTLAGPWRIGGRLAFDDMPMSVTVSTGTADPEGTLRLRVEALPDGLPIKVAADGQARLENGAAHYDGIFTLNTYTEEQIVRLRGSDGEQPVLTVGAATNRLSGRFGLEHDRLSVEEFRFETGPVDAPYRAEGTAVVELGSEPRFSITADGAQLRLEPDEQTEGAIAGVDLEKRLEALARAIKALPAPGIPGQVAVNLPAIVAGDTTIRNIALRAEPVEGGWSIGSFAATLPGRTRFEASGELAAREALAFEGHMLLAIAQPSGFAAWVSRDVDDAIRRLPAAGFSADVALSATRQSFDALELILGGARFTGSVVREASADTRPSLTVALDGEALDLEGIRAFMSLFVSDAGANRLEGHDVDLEIKAGPVTASGLTAQTLDSALRLREGVLEVDRLTVGGLAGTQISATGQIRDFASAPTGKIDATILSTDLSGLAKTLAGRFPENAVLGGIAERVQAFPGLLADAELNLVASAADNGDDTIGLGVSAEGVAGGTKLSLSLSDNSPRGAPLDGRFKLDLTAQNDDAAFLYGLAGLPALPLGLAGEAKLELSAEGSRADSIATRLQLTGDGLDTGFDGALTFKEGAPRLAGRTHIASDDIEPWLSVAGVVLPGFGLGMPVDLAAELEWSDRLAVLSGLTGSLAGSDVSGDLNIALDANKPRFDGALDLSRFDLAPVAELVLGPSAFSGEQSGEWPEVPFGQDVALPFSADLELRADALWAGFWAGGRNAAMKLKLDGEGMALSDLKAEIYGGTIDGFATLKNNAGTGLLTAQIGLEGAALDAVLPQASMTGKLDARTSVTASGKTVNGMVAALTGSGSAALSDLVIDGLNPDALGPILARADATGNGIDAEETAGFAPAIVRSGRFPAGATEFAFTVAGGAARTPPIRLAADGTILTAEISADLRDLSVRAAGSLLYDAGTEAVVGSEPAVTFETSGPFAMARTEISTAPLAQFLTQRALEREQVRVERMQSVLLEQQRLRREVRYFAALQTQREREEAERLRLERELKLRQEEEERARAAEEARRKAAAEEARRAAEEAERAARALRAAEEARRDAPKPPPEENRNIERRALPAPSPDANSADAVSEFFRAKSLSPERLKELLGPTD
ncbi:AsmA family protein [Nitratireductor sp. ZSWI3]|uniref:AsmA family protein n=1 Tax=Nitratireductor sp. ZSWI3 TaxID=2966359 RepID=UPI00214FFA4D|nr:AsmA family protein [Nitratireductor sp. ZSWI3]MCR4267119.1 AsmA family protein [Nitratireductor sp. ZSWI3]